MTEHAHIKALRECCSVMQAHTANLKSQTKNQVKLRMLNVLQDMIRHLARAIDEIDSPKKFAIPRVKRCE